MSLPVSLPTPALAVPGSAMSPLHGRPGSPASQTPIRISKAPGSMPRPSSRPLSCLAISGVPQSTELLSSSGGSVFPSSGEDLPAFRTPCSATWCGLPQPLAGQRDPSPATSHPMLKGCCRQSRHSCFAWTRSSLSFGVISRKVGQSPGACSLVQPNTGHCRGLSCSGVWSPPAAGDSPLASRAALAVPSGCPTLLLPTRDRDHRLDRWIFSWRLCGGRL
jgi:hypothetical protein